jgi:hypothetical protein
MTCVPLESQRKSFVANVASKIVGIFVAAAYRPKVGDRFVVHPTTGAVELAPEQTFDDRRENLNQANKLSRTYATLLEALNRHRGKGQQQVRVEHVHVHEGGQAIVGNVETKGGGVPNEVKEQPHALAHAPGATMPSPDTPREPVQVARDAERPLPHARRDLNGRAEGK